MIFYLLQVEMVYSDSKWVVMEARLKTEEVSIAMCAAASWEMTDPVKEAQDKAVAEVLKWAKKNNFLDVEQEEQLQPSDLWEEIFRLQRSLGLERSAIEELARAKFRQERLAQLNEKEVKLLLRHLHLVGQE